MIYKVVPTTIVPSEVHHTKNLAIAGEIFCGPAIVGGLQLVGLWTDRL